MNDHHGQNGQPKAFSFAPATDPITLKILDTRDAALRDTRLTRSMMAFFTKVLDRSLKPSAPGFQCKGSVSCSDSFLAHEFAVSKRTVYTWKKKLQELGYVWLSYLHRTNMEPITIYNITALIPPKFTTQESDGSSQRGAVRTGFRNGNGARQPKQPWLGLEGSRSPAPAGVILLEPLRLKRPLGGSALGGFHWKSDELQGISAASRSELLLSADPKIGGAPISTSADSRSPDRQSADPKIGGQPISTSAESRSFQRRTAEANCEHTGDSDMRLSVLKREGEGEPPRDLDLEKFRKSLEGEFSSRLEKRKAELVTMMKQSTPEVRPWFKARIAAIDEQLLGGKPPRSAKAAAPQPQAEPETAAPTPQERERLRRGFAALRKAVAA